VRSFTFVHAADLHLDSPFVGVTAEGPQLSGLLRHSTFRAFDSLVELCIREEALFLVIAGDVYDGADRSLRAQLRFRDGLARLSAAGIRTFVAHGNHDPLSGWSNRINWPEQVTVFGADEVQTYTVSDGQGPIATVSGISFRERNENRQLHREFTLPDASLFHVAVLHCNCGGDQRHDPYSPCAVHDLESLGFDYWALGHVHERKILCARPPIVYPGNTQGRSARELGERGCYLVRVDATGNAELDFRVLDAVRWETAEVDIASVATVDELVAKLEQCLEDSGDRAGKRPVLARIALVGSGPLYGELRRAGATEDLQERLREIGLNRRPPVWLEQLSNQCRPEIDVTARAQEGDLLGEVLQVALSVRAGGAALDDARAALSELYEHTRLRRGLAALEADELQDILQEAERLCIDLLEPER
jgi:exonuclease SbcD